MVNIMSPSRMMGPKHTFNLYVTRCEFHHEYDIKRPEPKNMSTQFS